MMWVSRIMDAPEKVVVEPGKFTVRFLPSREEANMHLVARLLFILSMESATLSIVSLLLEAQGLAQGAFWASGALAVLSYAALRRSEQIKDARTRMLIQSIITKGKVRS